MVCVTVREAGKTLPDQMHWTAPRGLQKPLQHLPLLRKEWKAFTTTLAGSSFPKQSFTAELELNGLRERILTVTCVAYESTSNTYCELMHMLKYACNSGKVVASFFISCNYLAVLP